MVESLSVEDVLAVARHEQHGQVGVERVSISVSAEPDIFGITRSLSRRWTSLCAASTRAASPEAAEST